MVVHDNHSDAPLLPIGNIERLHAIRPDRVDWVFEQTQIEAENRRREQFQVNWFIFVERMASMIAAGVVGVCGILGGVYAGLNGHDWLGGTVAVATIGTLAVSFLRKSRSEKE